MVKESHVRVQKNVVINLKFFSNQALDRLSFQFSSQELKCMAIRKRPEEGEKEGGRIKSVIVMKIYHLKDQENCINSKNSRGL